MSEPRCLRRKNKQEHLVADKKDEPPQRSVTIPDTTTTTTATDEKRKWRNRLFGRCARKKNKRKRSAPQDSTCDATSDDQTTAPKDKGKKTWWRQLFRCCRRRCRVSPAADINEEKKNPQRSRRSEAANDTDKQDKQGHSTSLSHQDAMMPFTTDFIEFDPDLEESFQTYEDGLLSDVTDYAAIMERLFLEALFKDLNGTESSFRDGGLRGNTIDRYGFPNVGQSCYLNSSLQSLLSLEDFIRSISCMEQVWSSVSEAQLLRRLMELRDVHASTDPQTKSHLLRSFKQALSVHVPEFRDSLQKDAHEFLTSVLDQIRSLCPLLQQTAAHMGRRYICPVEDHLVFRVENTRRCKRCQAQSTRQEEFTNLSLDLVPGGSVQQMLQEYLKETELEFRCECGGTTSDQSSTIATLPRILILHLKRFRFTPSFTLEKVHDRVELQRDLVVFSKQGGACYSLVSSISHSGCTGQSGHYICDSVHPEDQPDEPTDRWLTYNDSAVFETTGSSLCQNRQDSAYILFYKRHVSGVEQVIKGRGGGTTDQKDQKI